jgi:nitroreductase
MNYSESAMKIITARRSSRGFTDELIPLPVLDKIVQAGIYAPTGSNSQNIRFLIINDDQELKRIGESRFVWPYPKSDKARNKYPHGIIGNAAAAILVFSDNKLTDPRNHGEGFVWEVMNIQNASAAIQNMLLYASSCGIGNCWVSAGTRMTGGRLVSGGSWREILNKYQLGADMEIQGIVILGYPRHGTCDDGFPKGERKHGAAQLKLTQRKDIDFYKVKLGSIKHTRHQWPSKFIRVLQRILYLSIRVLDKLEYKINQRGD